MFRHFSFSLLLFLILRCRRCLRCRLRRHFRRGFRRRFRCWLRRRRRNLCKILLRDVTGRFVRQRHIIEITADARYNGITAGFQRTGRFALCNRQGEIRRSLYCLGVKRRNRAYNVDNWLRCMQRKLVGDHGD